MIFEVSQTNFDLLVNILLYTYKYIHFGQKMFGLKTVNHY